MQDNITISFDLDGTLLCNGLNHLADPAVEPLLSLTGSREDKLRLGALPLLKALVAEGYSIWIYTRSYRGKSEVVGWFKALSVPLAGYVNGALHQIACEKHGIVGELPMKCPHLFDIDVHVDDDPQIAEECRETSCRVIVIQPEEVDFEACVRAALLELGA